MDGALVGKVITVICIPAIPLGWFLWKSRQLTVTENWPCVEGVVASSDLEVVTSARSGAVSLPVCDFSYQVDQKYYSGRFSLVPNVEAAELLAKRMAGKTIRVKYNPWKPSVFYIPDAQIEGADVHQKYGALLGAVVPRN